MKSLRVFLGVLLVISGLLSGWVGRWLMQLSGGLSGRTIGTGDVLLILLGLGSALLGIAGFGIACRLQWARTLGWLSSLTLAAIGALLMRANGLHLFAFAWAAWHLGMMFALFVPPMEAHFAHQS